ncbi:MAG: hypothetical protein K6G64_05165 [Eubacterium sp.]|nr:hypothetical protein [Eubacterium sp.]
MNNKIIISIIGCITLICAIILCVAFFGIHSKKVYQTSPVTQVKETKAKPVSATADNTLLELFSGNGLKLSIKSLEDSSIVFSIENQTEQSVTASCHSIAINKVMTQLMILESVNAGEIKDVTISLEEYSAFCGIEKSEDIKNITLDFICTNIQDEVLFSGDVQTFDFGDFNYAYLPDDSAKTLYTEKSIDISATDFKDNADNNAERYVIIENNSDSLITTEILGIFVNDSDLNNFSYSEIYPNCIFYFPVTTDGISSNSIKKVSMELTCSDADYNELFHTTIEK